VSVVSTWGEQGHYLHPADVHPYNGADVRYYRSGRAGHMLYGLPSRPTPRTIAQALDVRDPGPENTTAAPAALPEVPLGEQSGRSAEQVR
jgi:hypothetical protein